MIDLRFNEYNNEECTLLIESIGYKRKIHCFVFHETDGYIDILFYMLKNGCEVISFHKYFNDLKRTLNKEFFNYIDFEKFFKEYHKQDFRKIKLNNILRNNE